MAKWYTEDVGQRGAVWACGWGVWGLNITPMICASERLILDWIDIFPASFMVRQVHEQTTVCSCVGEEN